jgi:hypothetical protein
MRLPRMTKRRWMVAVAIVPILLLAAMVIERRRESFRQLALRWADDEAIYSHQLGIILPDPPGENRPRDFIQAVGKAVDVDPRGTGLPKSPLELALRVAEFVRPHRRNEGIPPSQVEWTRRRVEYAVQLRLKYEHATRYPWLAVEPDPPLPEP